MLKKSLIALVLLVLITSVSYSYSDDIPVKLDELMSKFDKIGMFSGTVLLARDGAPVYEKSFGYADWENKTPISQNTVFNIGSINKAFTSAIINQLENEDKLKKSDNLGKYIKLYNDDRDNKITIQMLVEMKAGLGDYGQDPAFLDNIEKFKTVNDFLEIIKNEPLLYEPGTGQEYSNSGYVVLGGIIEKITGKSWFENVKERFLTPLGMNRTFFKQRGDKIEDCAAGTRLTFSGKKISEKFEFMPSPAGGLYMSAGDLLKFCNEITRTKIIFEATRAGGTEVWNAVMGQYKNGYSLIILSNFNRAAEEVEMRFRNILEGKSYPEPDISLDMKLYKILVEQGAAELGKNLKSILESNDMEYRPVHLNRLGYSLISEGELDKSIEVFTLNTQLFPNRPNVWDSLAEAYMNKGDNEKAIMYYKKVLDMEPGNQNAKKMLEKLQK